MDRVETETTQAASTEMPRNYWGIMSIVVAAAMLPLWGFFALSSITWQDPLKGEAPFNLLTPQAIAFISHYSLELALVIAMMLIMPIALLATALTSRPDQGRPGRDKILRFAIALNAFVILLVVVTVFPLFVA